VFHIVKLGLVFNRVVAAYKLPVRDPVLCHDCVVYVIVNLDYFSNIPRKFFSKIMTDLVHRQSLISTRAHIQITRPQSELLHVR